MKRNFGLSTALLSLICLMVGCDSDKVTNNSDSSVIIGTWRGSDEGTIDVAGFVLTFDADDNFIFENGGGIYTSDASVTPHHIDLVFDEDVMWEGNNIGRNFFGLWEIIDGKLKANWNPDVRSESFEKDGYHIWIKQ